MAATEVPGKPVFWMGSSLRDLRDLDAAIQRDFGFALFEVQSGEVPEIAKPLRGFGGASVLELVVSDRSGTYRCVYSVKFAGAVYVLHTFQKKSKSGITTPKAEMDLVRVRLKQAQVHYGEQLGRGRP